MNVIQIIFFKQQDNLKNYTVRDPTGQIVETEVKFIEKFYFYYL